MKFIFKIIKWLFVRKRHIKPRKLQEVELIAEGYMIAPEALCVQNKAIEKK